MSAVLLSLLLSMAKYPPPLRPTGPRPPSTA